MNQTKKGYPLRSAPELLDAIKALAKKDGRTINNYINKVLSDHVKAKNNES